MIPYDPKDALTAWPEGEYMATLENAEETLAKSSGKPMYKLEWKVYGDRGEMTLFDYAAIPSMLWKIKKLARSLGRLEEFNAGTFDPSVWIGRNVRVSLEIQDDPKYGDRNVITDYAEKVLRRI